MGTKKFSTKLKAIKLLFGAKQYIVFTVKGDKADVAGYGRDDLAEVMAMAIQIRKSYNFMVRMIEDFSQDEDELQKLVAMRKAITAVDNREIKSE